MGLFLIKTFAKSVKLAIDLLRLGAGYTWPGHLVLKIFPKVLQKEKLLPRKGVILISGTNGKTTTAKLIAHILENRGFSAVSNASGANLVSGVVSVLCLNSRADYGVFEIDEFALPQLLAQVKPVYLVLLNLSRDQLDRYGETDTILEKWKDALSRFSGSATLILDSTQKKFSELPQIFKGTTLFFNDDPKFLDRTVLKGHFNVKNLNAALLVATGLGVPEDSALKSLENFSAAWGRGEVLEKNGKKFRILLAKNPTSFNNNLSLLINEVPRAKVLLLALNDNIPDGRDVSWIYDVDRELLGRAAADKEMYVTGTRAFDMAVRLKYAGILIKQDNVSPNLSEVLEKLLNQKTSDEITVLPNYSAMLEFREKLIGRKIL